MAEITLEKIDIIRERIGVSYAEAKEALEHCEGDVVDTLIYFEQMTEDVDDKHMNEFYTTIEEFKEWLKDTIRVGNVTRIKIKKDERTIVDVPVNAGIAAGMFAILWPPLVAIGMLTAVVTKITVEITKNDGSVEVVNTIIKSAVNDISNKVNEVTEEVKDKVFNKENDQCDYEFTVKFDEEDKVEENSKEKCCEENCCEEKCCEEKCCEFDFGVADRT
jgi:uncharacterized protein DUF4342